ncbi:MAG TPA: thiamine-phosphate synthase family protein, partial [Methanobacteriaceae archaeon]|nr:thiamine-phosphate synthase family protein [Methanobacteriaceae archaeon]
EFALLIPEVRSNLVMSKISPHGMEDVAGVPGRITVINRKPDACAAPDYGVSSHMARLVLSIMKYDPDKRSAMNMKYDPLLVDICQKLGLIVSYYDRKDEPLELRDKEGSTIPWGVETAVERIDQVPDVIYQTGSFGKEPSLVLIGESAVEVVKTAVCIAKLFKERVSEN